ncbi:MAG: enoyl-CoA hydratase/isomerase family protein [Chloroflexi bacterium]|nr:enoyl-CoA hydratase/isomerase family protein [Chloroflexota bacterium]
MGEITSSELFIGEHKYYNIDYSKGYKRIIYQPGRVTRIIMNRPRYKNALSHPHLWEIEDAFNRASADPECRVIVLSGAGDSFSAGDDALGLTPESAPMMAHHEETPPEAVKKYGREGNVWRYYQEEHFWLLHGQHGRLRFIMKPTIAMVHGYCIFNAFSLASCMDLIFATDDALFLPVGGGMWDLGPRKWLEVHYEHRFLTAREMMEFHMVSRVYPDFATLEKETLAFAERVANQPVRQLAGNKAQYYHHLNNMGFGNDYDDHTFHELAYGGGAASPIRDVPEEDKHRERFEGKGMARTPVALRNLKAKLEGEGKPVPQNVLAAVARADARDDRGTWERALSQDWRDKSQAERAKAQAEAYDKAMATKTKETGKGKKK